MDQKPETTGRSDNRTFRSAYGITLPLSHEPIPQIAEFKGECCGEWQEFKDPGEPK